MDLPGPAYLRDRARAATRRCPASAAASRSAGRRSSAREATCCSWPADRSCTKRWPRRALLEADRVSAAVAVLAHLPFAASDAAVARCSVASRPSSPSRRATWPAASARWLPRRSRSRACARACERRGVRESFTAASGSEAYMRAAVRPGCRVAGRGRPSRPRRARMSDVFLSVVLPCRDQEDHIEAVLKSYAAPLESTGRRFELVVVPNACRDRTPEVVSRLAAADERIRVRGQPTRRMGTLRADRPGRGPGVGPVLHELRTHRSRARGGAARSLPPRSARAWPRCGASSARRRCARPGPGSSTSRGACCSGSARPTSTARPR